MSISPEPTSVGKFVAPLVLAALSLAVVLATQANIPPHSSVADHPTSPFAIGVVLAFVAGLVTRTSPPIAGIAALSGFPLWAIGDLSLHGAGSHGLLPFEFLFYGVYMALGWLAALLGRRLRRVTARPVAS